MDPRCERKIATALAIAGAVILSVATAGTLPIDPDAAAQCIATTMRWQAIAATAGAMLLILGTGITHMANETEDRHTTVSRNAETTTQSMTATPT